MSAATEVQVQGGIRTGDARGGSATGGTGGSAQVVTNVFVESGYDIHELVNAYNFAKIRDVSSDDYLHVDLAPSYGGLSKESIKLLDSNLKVMIAGTVRMIKKIPPSQRKWKTIEQAFTENNLVESSGEPVHRKNMLLKKEVHAFKMSGAADVKLWFHNLVNDSDVLAATPISIEELAEIVAWSGATFTDIGTAIYKAEKHEKKIMDIGILRFPDSIHPYFKVYHISLKAWSYSSRVVAVQSDNNGIEGEFYSRIFKPRKEILAKMNPEVIQKAVSEAESMFDD
ncbi:hypothetical protein CFO_g4167 [Ceratocystis platani]|uniref:Uncharacterized protein n=1 Tax=Ceratocystis fimbriata f. sp. platani TaxID=88771 RepID=A0A0F8AYQ3_CERFI|nr:hypothetical protein CFO_g4167 [Ceratocystis platani]